MLCSRPEVMTSAQTKLTITGLSLTSAAACCLSPVIEGLCARKEIVQLHVCRLVRVRTATSRERALPLRTPDICSLLDTSFHVLWRPVGGVKQALL